MKKAMLIIMALLVITTTAFASFACGGKTDSKPKFTIMWSVYVGWMPWPYAQDSGILKKWADKYNVEIDLKRADYIPSIEAYVAGQADGVVMTNMEGLNMAAAAGVDTTAIIIGDYSNGNDAVLTRNKLTLPQLKGKKVNIVELSVSQYLLERGLAMQGKGVTVKDMTLENTSDADIGPAFIANSSQVAVVTWNPMVLDILEQVPGVTNAFNSSQIPGEILDIMFVKTDVIKKHPELGKALTGAWYETLGVMTAPAIPTREKALKAMAEESGTTLASYQKQLETTAMYWTPDKAVSYAKSQYLEGAMDLVRYFSFEHGLWTNAKTVDDIGISLPNGTILGNRKNIKLRFDASFMQLAADGKL